MKSLRYIGKHKNRRLNGRALDADQVITDPVLVRDLDGHPEFETHKEPDPVIDQEEE